MADPMLKAELLSMGVPEDEINRLRSDGISYEAIASAAQDIISRGESFSDGVDFVVRSKNGELRVSPVLLAGYIRRTRTYYLVQMQPNKDERYVYLYEHGVYRRVSKTDFLGLIKSPVQRYVPELLKMRDIDEVYSNLTTDIDNVRIIDEFNTDENIINFQNGILDLRTMSLRAHSPNDLTTVQIPCAWSDTDLNTPCFDSYFDTLTDGNDDVKKLLLEYIGGIISNRDGQKHKQALFLVGAGNTGKSVLFNFVYSLLENNASIGSLDALESQFGAYRLFNKRLFGHPDHPFCIIREFSTFKNLTGSGDSIYIEQKYHDGFDYHYRGFLLFCMNELPSFGGDHGKHVYDRMIIVRCNNVISAEKRDPELLQKLKAEATGIVRKAVYAYRECLDNGAVFTMPTCCVQELEQYKVNNSPYLSFYYECCTQRTNRADKCTTGKLHEAMRLWFKQNYPTIPCQPKVFVKELQSNGINTEQQKRSSWYYPFTLTPDAKEQFHIFD